MEARDEGHRDGPQGGVDEHHEVGQRHRVPQHSQGSRARNHLDAAALQRSDRPGRAAQGVHAREHGAQVAARVVAVVGQGQEKREGAHGNDNGLGRGGHGAGCSRGGHGAGCSRGGRGAGCCRGGRRIGLDDGGRSGVVGLGALGDGPGQRDDVDEPVADRAGDERNRLGRHLAQPQPHPLLEGVPESLAEPPPGAVRQTQLGRRRRGEVGECGQLQHPPDPQVPAPGDPRELADSSRVDAVTAGERLVEHGARGQSARRDDAWREEHRRQSARSVALSASRSPLRAVVPPFWRPGAQRGADWPAGARPPRCGRAANDDA